MPFGEGSELGLPFGDHLRLQRCPHCSVAHPAIISKATFDAKPGRQNKRAPILQWSVFACQTCGGLIGAAAAKNANGSLIVIPNVGVRYGWLVPAPRQLSAALPERVGYYLGQAQETLTSPSASVVMSAAAVDAMLKNKGYKTGSLHNRIEMATADGLITKDMAAVAHDVRLDANNERHVDDSAAPPTDEDAQRCFDFADALADLMFVLPARVRRKTVTPGTASLGATSP